VDFEDGVKSRHSKGIKLKKLAIFIRNYFFGLFSCLHLFSIGILTAQNRGRLADLCGFFGYRQKFVKPIIPKINPSTIIPECLPVDIRSPETRDGNVTLFELLIMAKLVRVRQPKTIFEIGTYDGRTTLNLAANASPDAKILTLDLPKNLRSATALKLVKSEERYINKEVCGERFERTDQEGKITQLYGDSATFDFTSYANSMDVVFIDGSHSSAYVRNDSLKAVPLLRDGHGIILWHDYDGWQDVTRVLNELYLSGRPFDKIQHIEGTTLACLIL
jgi:hypothetical protein